MLTGHSLSAPTIATAWESGLSLFGSPTTLYRHDSERGVAFEIPCLTLAVDSAEDTSLPARYRYPDLVTDYADRLFEAQRETSLANIRMRAWSMPDDAALDQVAAAVALLRRSPETRTAAFSLWRPDQDLNADFPVSPIAGCFRVIAGKTHLYLVARSVDYWVGAVPELVAFARLQASVAAELEWPAGSLVYHMWSAHIYEVDCLTHLVNG